MTGSAQTRRLYWRSKRGLLELELLLVPFFNARFETLAAADRDAYARLLKHDDVDIYQWLQGKAPPPEPELEGIVERIRSFHHP